MNIAKSLSCKLKLNDGHWIPMFGLGTYRLEKGDEGEAERICLAALEKGYRLLDTAKFYRNEKEVGQAIKKSGLERSEVYVVSKLMWDNHGQDARKWIDMCLKNLDLDYIDLFMIHSPIGGKILETYDILLEYQKKGLIKSIGVSNFGIRHLEGLLISAKRPAPAVIQTELHLWQHKPEVVQFCRDKGITVMGFCPLARCRFLDDEKLIKMAEKYGKTKCQIMIRWSVQNGYITIPKTSKPERLDENADVFDFELSDDDMKSIDEFETRTVMSTEPDKSDWKPE